MKQKDILHEKRAEVVRGNISISYDIKSDMQIL